MCVCVQIRKKESCERMVERTAREREREVHVDGEALRGRRKERRERERTRYLCGWTCGRVCKRRKYDKKIYILLLTVF